MKDTGFLEIFVSARCRLQITKNLHGSVRGIHFSFHRRVGAFLGIFQSARTEEGFVGAVFSSDAPFTLLLEDDQQFPLEICVQTMGGRNRCVRILRKDMKDGPFRLKKPCANAQWTSGSTSTSRPGRRMISRSNAA